VGDGEGDGDGVCVGDGDGAAVALAATLKVATFVAMVAEARLTVDVGRAPAVA
jgi:hypothetical protein